MDMTMINEYLKRIAYKDKLVANKEVLFSLHQHHVFSICFENLDIQLGRNLSLKVDDVFEKVVLNKRGGYCFEVNNLFASILEYVGFDVQYCGSRVWYGYDPSNGMRPRAHKVLIVTIDGSKYLVDVSFGNGFLLPLELNKAATQNQFGRSFQIRPDEELGTKVYMLNQQEWLLLFSFTEEKCYSADYEVASYYASNHQNSLFTQKLICTLPNENGRKIILDREYIEIIEGKRSSTQIESNDHLLKLLNSEFDIEFHPHTYFPQFNEGRRKVS